MLFQKCGPRTLSIAHGIREYIFVMAALKFTYF
jgi:hypothetical protein